jgi:hypothetical protein
LSALDAAPSPLSSSPISAARFWAELERCHALVLDAPGSWLPEGKPLTVSSSDQLTKLQQELSTSPASQKENTIMHPAFIDLLVQLCPSCAKLPPASGGKLSSGGVSVGGDWKLLHTYSTALSGLKPDFSLFPATVNSSSLAACAFTLELQLPPLDTEHRGRCATYNNAMLEANPKRLFALSATTDLKSIMFLRTIRDSSSSGVQHFYSSDLVVVKGGWEVLLNVLQHPDRWTGFLSHEMQLTGQAVELSAFLGCGVSSEVWLGKVEGRRDVVCKMFQHQDDFEEERTTWEGIQSREATLATSARSPTHPLHHLSSRRRLAFVGYDVLSARVGSSAASTSPSFYGTLFFEPCGETATIKAAEEVREVFACLEWLRALRVIHRDLSPRHFLRCGVTGVLFLIDFGFAVLLPLESDLSQESDAVPFSGSSYYAPTSVLDVLRTDGSAIYPAKLAHDLESLVKLCYCRCYELEEEKLKRNNRHSYQSIYDFWRQCEQRMANNEVQQRWVQAFAHARNNNLEDTRNAVMLYFQNR